MHEGRSSSFKWDYYIQDKKVDKLKMHSDYFHTFLSLPTSCFRIGDTNKNFKKHHKPCFQHGYLRGLTFSILWTHFLYNLSTANEMEIKCTQGLETAFMEIKSQKQKLLILSYKLVKSQLTFYFFGCFLPLTKYENFQVYSHVPRERG